MLGAGHAPEASPAGNPSESPPRCTRRTRHRRGMPPRHSLMWNPAAGQCSVSPSAVNRSPLARVACRQSGTKQRWQGPSRAARHPWQGRGSTACGPLTRWGAIGSIPRSHKTENSCRNSNPFTCLCRTGVPSVMGHINPIGVGRHAVQHRRDADNRRHRGIPALRLAYRSQVARP